MTKYILSVDGGGIRGIIPSIILAEIEKRARKPISEIFDLMAGTSTGGILVAGLCKKDKRGNIQYSANEMVDFYRKHGPFIFESSFWRKHILSQVNCAKYSHKNLETILDKYFDKTTITDVSNKLLLPCYDIRNNGTYFFKSWKSDSIKLKDALRAATAAPTYFIPKDITINQTERVLVDGGIFANNPAACAYASCKKLFPNYNIIVLSIGTGKSKKTVEFINLSNFGMIQWIQPLLHAMFNSELDNVNYLLNQIIGDKYVRIQTELKIASGYMDNITTKNIESLQQEANMTIENNQKLIDKFSDI